MKSKFLALMLLAGGALLAQPRFSIGVGIGAPAPRYYAPRPVYVDYRPPCPGPDYFWVDGFWRTDFGRRHFIAGHWNRRPAYVPYRYAAPRYDRYQNRRFRGYSNGYRGR